MPYLILSDVHSNLEALQAVLADAQGRYNKILCLGDLVGYGADPDAVVEWARKNVATIVRGNHPVAEIGPAHRRTGADLRAALADVPPPDDEFSQAIAEAVAMVTSEVRDPWADA